MNGPDPAPNIVGRYVTVRYPGNHGITTIRSHIVDVSVDGDEVEIAAAEGHLFPLDTVTFEDFDGPADHPPIADSASEPNPALWGPPNQFEAPGHLTPLAPPGTVSIDDWRAADPRRYGPEVGYGDFWTFDDPNDWYSIAWNAVTGDLYTYRQKDRTVLVRAVIPNRADVDALLHGWQRDQFHEYSGYPACGSILEHQNAVRPPAAPSTARDIVTSWHQAALPPPADPPLGLA